MPCSTEPSSSVRRPPMWSEIQPETSRLTMPKASISDSISRAARRAEAEIAAVGDDVHLRHRHRDAAGHPGDAQQALQRRGRESERALRDRRGDRLPAAPARTGAAGGSVRGRTAAQHQRERQHRQQAEHADADVGLAPARAVDEVLQDRRPHGARQVVAAHADRHGDAAPAREPLRGVRHQRRERGRGAEQSDQHALRQR